MAKRTFIHAPYLRKQSVTPVYTLFLGLVLFLLGSARAFTQGPGCPNVNLGADVTKPCSTSCITLNADFLQTGATTAYSVTGIPFTPPYPFNSGTSFSIGTDDIWSGVINLPFNFCFFGTNYNQVVVGANGVISFNTAYANGTCPWQFTNTLPYAGNNTYGQQFPRNAIFGAYHDVDPSVCGNIRYAILGSYPCRTFVFNYDAVCQYSCTGNKTTQQIVLYETTNAIEVYIQNKAACTGWNSGNAIIGIQNAAGTVGYAAPGRNGGSWATANEAWRFTPSGTPNYTISWHQGAHTNPSLGSGPTLSVCPTAFTTYSAVLNYTRCDGSVVTVWDAINVSIEPNPPAPSFTTNSPVCEGQTINLNATAVSGATYVWAGPGGWTSTGQNTTRPGATPAMSGTYSLYVVVNGCTSATTTQNVTVNPRPTVNPVGNQTVCAGSPTAAVTFAGSPVAGTTYNWTSSNTAIGSAASGSNTFPSFTATNTGSAPISSTITVTPTANGCPGTPIIFTVTVNPRPSVNPVGNQTVCAGSPTAGVTFAGSGVAGTTYNWTSSNTAVGSAASGSNTFPSFTATNTGSAPISSTITVTPTANGCSGTPITFTVTVNPIPTVTAVANQTYCHGTTTSGVNFNGSVAGTSYTWTNSNTAIGLAGSGVGNIGPFTATNTGTAPITSTITVTPTAFGCTGTPITFTITVNPIPNPGPVGNQTVCAGASTSAVNFSSGVSGTLFLWSNNNTATGLGASGVGNIASFTGTNTGTTPITSTVSVTPIANACTGTPFTFTITVNPRPTVNAVPNQTVCAGAATTAVTFGGAVAGTTYNWTSSNPAIGSAASGVNTFPSFTATNAGTTPISSTITVTPTANGCSGTPITFTVTVNPIPPTPNFTTNSPVCQGQQIDFFGPNIAGATYFWSGPLGWTQSGTNANIGNATPAMSGTYSLYVVVNGCTSATATQNVTVNPTPAVNPVGNQTLCNGAPTAAINFTGPVAGTTYNWTNNNTGIGLAASGNGNIPSFTAVNTGSAPVTATITVTPTAGGCPGSTPTTFTITVNPTPTVNAVGNQTLCAGASTAAVNFGGAVTGTSYNWSNNTTSIGLGASGSGNIGSFTATNTGTTPVTATVTVTPSANGCTGTPGNFTITVNPRPTVNAVPNQTLCHGATTTAVNFTGSLAGATYNWTNSNPAIGLAASGNGNIGAFTATNTGTTPVTATITVTPTAAGCSGTPITFTITVNPTPATPNFTTNSPVCQGQQIDFFGPNIAGATYFWSGPLGWTQSGTNANIANATPAMSGTYSLYVVVNGCTSATATQNVTVVPTPTVNTVPNQTLCNGATTAAVNFTGSAGVTGYTWTNNTPSIGLAGSGTGNIGAFTATNTGSAPVTATVTVTPVAGACTGTPTTFTITVNPTPTVNTVPNQTLCHGAPTAAVNFAGPVTGTAFNWTNNTTSIGLAGSGNGNIPSFTATNTGTTPVTATVTATPSANGCTGTPGTFTITVNPIPTVNTVPDQTLCNGATSTAVTFSGAVAGTTYNWTSSNPAVGSGASGSNTLPSFTATNAGNAPISSTITVTPTVNGCAGTPTTFTVTVNPTPTVNVVPNQTLCNGAASTAVTFGGNVAGATYNWTSSNPAVGSGASGSNTLPSFTGTNAGTAPISSTITVTPTANGCPGTPVTFTVTVNPTPTVNAVPNQTLCAGATTTAVNFTGAVTGTTYNWTNTDGTIGLATAGVGNIPAFTATNTGTAPVTSTITVTPTAGGCAGTPTTFTVTVNPTPVVNTISNQTLCNGANTAAINFTGGVAGTAYNWTNNTTSIGLAGSGNGNIPSFTASNPGTTPVTATVTVTPGANGCTGTPGTFTITVNPTPTVNAVPNQTLCAGATTTAVNFTGTVAGTTYAWSNNNTATGLAASGNGNIGTFTATNTGTTPITSVVTVVPGAAGCPGASTTFTITVNPTPTVDPVADQTLCNNATTAAVNFTGAVTGTTYNWTNSNTGIGLAGSGSGNIGAFTATNTGTAPVTATVTVTPTANGCPGTPETFTITVNPTPTVDNVTDQTLCNGATTTAINFTNPVAGTTYAWTNNTPSIGLAGSGTGNIGAFTATNTGTAPVTATVTVTPTANGCPGTPETFTITVNPTPTVDPVADQTLCNNATTTAVNFTGAVTGTTYNWTNSDASIGLAGSGAGNIGVFTATNTGTAPVTATVTVTPTANGCPGTPETFTITVNPTPTVDPVADQTLCNGATTTAINFTNPVAGTTYAWTNTATSIGLAGSGNGNIGAFTATNTGTAPVTATVTVTPTANGCPGTPETFTITVNPTPTVDPVADQTLCNNATTTAVNFTGAVTGTTYNWTNNTTSIGLAGSGSGNIGTFTATNTGTAPVTATVTVTPTANGCPGAAETFTITVNPTPTVDPVSDQTLCNGATTTAINFTNPVAGTTYAWTNTATSIGLAGSGNGNIGAFTATNTGNAPVTATVTVTPTANGCPGTPETFTITVNPTPTVDPVADQTLCNNATTTAINFTGNVAGTTYNWANTTTSIGLAGSGVGNIGTFTATNTGTAPVTATVTVTPTANGCPGPAETFTITVNPTPTVDPVADQTLCNGATTTAINFTNPVAGTTYAWTNSDATIGLAAAGNGNIGAFTATNTGNAPVTATVTVTPTANGCPGTPETFTITVNPTPTVDPVADQTLCNNATTTAVNFTGAVTGTTYNWTNNTTSIGLAGSGSGNIGTFTATNTGTTPVTATVTVTPTANGCPGAAETFTITVNPTPTVDPVADQTLCNGAATTAVNFTGAVTGTTYNWTNSDASIGLAGSGAGNIGTFTATNTGSAPVTATVTVTPTANGCPGTPETFTITVNPTPTVDPVADQTLCTGNTTTAINFAGAVAGTTYDWTNTTTSIGLAGSGTGNIGAFTATNTGNAPVTATVTVTPTANGCTGPAETFTITVNPTLETDPVSDQILCNGAASTVVTFTGPVAGATFAWSNDQTSIGLAATGNGNIGSFTAVNTGTAPVTATITITPSANGCVGDTSTFTITVNPTPTVDPVTDQTLCNNAGTTAVNFTGPVAGTTYAWTNNTPSIGLAGSGNGNIGAFTATNTGSAPVTATVTVTPTANGCPGTPETFTITVNPTPTVDPMADQTLCNNATTTAVNFTNPVAGTTYAWTNSDATIGLAGSGNGNIGAFTATNTGTAPVTATVTVTPTANGCPGPAETFTITVNPTPTVDNVADQTLCSGATTTAINFTNPVAGTSYAWTNNTTSIGLAGSGTGNIGAFTATNTGTAPVTATVTVTPTANGCPGTPETFTITVNPTPTVDPVADQTLCNNATTTAINFTNPVAGTTYAWTNSDATIGLAGSGNGNIGAFTATNAGTAPVTATITVTPTANGCPGTPETFTITVNPTPTVDNVADQTLCNGATTTAINFTNPVAGTSYAWTNNTTSIGLAGSGTGNIGAFTATNTGTAPVTATISVTPTANGCPGTPETFTITVNPTPTVDPVADQTLCNNATTTAINFTNPVAGTTYAWTNSDASIGLAGSGNGDINSFTATNTGTAPVTATVTVTPTANGCPGTPETFTITVNPTPTVDPVADQTLCNNATTTAVTFTNPVAGTTYAWTNSDATIGLAGSGNGNIGAFTATNTGTAPVTATISVTPTANGCPGTPETFTITVNPTPTVDPVADQTLCNNATTTAINFTNPVAGTTYAWTNSDATIGLAGSGNGNIGAFTATNTGTAPVTATVTVTPTANGCPGTPETFTITVNPTPTVDPVADQTLCNNATTTAVTFTNPVAGTTYAWTNSDATIGLAGSGNGNIGAFTGTNTGTAPVTATVTVTPTANGCPGTPETFTITVNPTPTVDPVADQTLCNNATTTAVTFTNPVAGTTYAWTNSDATIGLVGSGNGNIGAFTATNTGTAPVTATVTVTPTANGCPGTPETFTITVNPTPTVDPVVDQTLCNNATTTAINFTNPVAGTTYAWTNSDATIGLAGSGNGNIGAFTATNTGTAPVTATVTVTPTANGCPGTAETFTITVNPTPTVDNVTDQTLCNGSTTTAVNFTSPVAGTTYAWTNNTTSIGLAVSGNGNIGAFTATNPSNAPVTATVTVTPTANGCPGTVETFTITVNPAPEVNAVADQTLCNGAATAAVLFGSPTTGATFAWTNSDASIGLAVSGNGDINSFTATNTGTAPVTATISVTATANGCPGPVETFTITVNPTPTVDPVADQTLCNGATTTAINFTNPVAGTTYAWTNSDATIGLAGSGNGNIGAFTATNTGTAPVTATVTVTPTANGCPGTAETFTITVNPTPSVDNVADQILCNNATTTAINFSNPVAGTTYAWTNSDASIGLSATGNGNIGAFTATNTGTAPVTATVTVTPTANGCPGTVETFTITVNPTPTVDPVADQTLCNNATTTAINFTNPVAGTTYAWTNSDASIGLAGSGNGDINSFTATNTGTAPVTATVTVTPTANGCPGTPETFTITVNPTPTVDNVADQTLCNNATTTAVNFTGPVAGTTYAWTNSDATIGLAAAGNGNIGAFTATNTGTAPVTATVTVTPTANGCPGTPETFTITVNPTPSVDPVADQTLCNNATTTAINFTNPVAGTTYAWTNSDATIGLAAAGNGNIGVFTATNTGTAPVTATVTVTPTANGCPGTAETFTITVNPTPSVDPVADQTLCNNATTAAINFTNPVAGTTYAWTNSDASIGLAATGNGNIAAFTATNAGTAPVTATVTVTPTANGCPGTAETFTITVNPTPSVDPVADQTLCNNATTTAINFTNPVAGTTYAWTNSDATIGLAGSGNGNIGAFTATNTGTAPVTATVTVTPTANGCPGTVETFTVTVNPTPTVDNVTDQTLCNGSMTTAVNFTNPVAGTTYAWTNSDATIGLAGSGNGNIGAFTATNTGTAPVTATVTVTPTANGCVGVDETFTITVNPAPQVNAVADQTLCNGAATAAVTFGSPTAGATFAWTNSDASIGLGVSGNGDINSFTATNTGTAPVTATISVTATANGCPGPVETFTVTVNPTPTVDNVADQTLCNNATTTAVNFTGPVAGTTYAWTNSDVSIGLAGSGNGNIGAFTATNAGTAPVTATVTITPTANGCPGTTNSFDITVNPTPTVDNVADQTLCNNATTTAVNFTGPVAGTTYAWTNSDASIGLAATGNGNIGAFTATNAGTAPVTATVTITPTANGCTGPTNTFDITVNPTPSVDNVADQTLCNNAATTAINFSNPVAGTTYAWTNSDATIGLAGSGNGNIAAFNGVNTGTAPVTATVTVTPTANGCPGTVETFTITVNPTPTVDNVADQTLCNNATTTAVNFTGPVAGTTYAWTNSDASIGLAATGNGNIGAFTATNTGTAPVTATVTITPTANGCTGPTNTFDITVNPTPSVDNVPDQTLCNNATTTAVNFTNPVAGTTYAWVNNTTSIGLAGSGNGNIAAFTATNTGTAPVTATITATPTANGCTGTTETFTITVNPTPTVNNVADQTLCNNATTTAINFTNPVAGTTYAWTNSDATIGLAAAGNGNIGAFTAINTGTAPVTATVTVTPTANACPGTVETFTITVNPTPTADNVADQTVCNGANTTAVTFTSPTAGTTFAWTNNDASIGLAASGNGNIAAFAGTNTGTAPVTGTVTVTPTANGCAGPTNTFDITVNPTPTVNNVADQTLCNNATTSAVNFAGPVAGTTFAWANSNASIGLAASGTGNIGAFTATNTGTAPVTATVTVTPTANGCVGTPDTFDIKVNPTPTVNAIADQTLCNGDNTAAVTFTNLVVGTTYTWTNNNTGISLAANGAGTGIPSFTAGNLGSTTISGTITVTPTANSCVGTPETFVVTVHPTFVGTENGVICNGDTYTFGGQPYTTAGSYPVTFQTVHGCDSLVTLNLTVNPVYHQVINTTICRGSSYTFNGVQYNATGNYPVAFTTVNGCDSTFMINLTVQGPVANFNAQPPVGCVPLRVTFDNLSAPGVVSSSWNFGNGTTSTDSDPIVTYYTPGTYTVSLVVADALGCRDSMTSVGLIVVNEIPKAGMVVSPQEVWMDEPYISVTDASAGASSWWYSITDGTSINTPDFTHSFTDTGSFVVMQVVYNAAGCSDSTFEVVQVHPVSTFYVPNAFSPNTDFNNPLFKAVGNTFSEYEMRVFNRWGELIYQTQNIDEGWDGTYMGKPCPVDVYVYKITYRDHRKKLQSLIGSVTLVR